jgi:hypothetical protein
VPSRPQARDLTAALITTFAQRFQTLGVRFAVVVLPYAEDQSPDAEAGRLFLISHLEAAKIPTLVPNFSRLPNGRFDIARFMVSALDERPNRQYNLVLVNQLRQFLESTGIITHPAELLSRAVTAIVPPRGSR